MNYYVKQMEEMSAKVTPLQRIKTETGGSGVKFCTNDVLVLEKFKTIFDLVIF